MMDEEFKIIRLNNSDSEPDVDSKEQVITGNSSDELNEDALEATPKLIHTDTTRKMKKSTMQTYKTMRSQLVQSSSIEVRTTKSTQKNNLQQMDKSDQEVIECVGEKAIRKSKKTETINERFKRIGFNNSNRESDVRSEEVLIAQSSSKKLDRGALVPISKPSLTDTTRRWRKSKVRAYKAIRSQLVQSPPIKTRATKFTQKTKLLCEGKSDQRRQIEFGSKTHKSTYCKACNKDFLYVSLLNQHIRRSHSQPSTCDICFKTLKSQVQLNAHLRIHAGIKKHSCAYCDKKFLRKFDLTCHERFHTGDMPYKCQYCGLKFPRIYGLKVHERIHTGETPYKCQYCEKSFKQKICLKTHEKKCHLS